MMDEGGSQNYDPLECGESSGDRPSETPGAVFLMRLFYLKKGGLGCLPTPITCISSSPALVPSHHLLLLSLLYPFPLGLSQSEHPSISQACLALEVFLKG